MRVDIRSHHIDNQRTLRAYAATRLELAVRRFHDRIMTAQVHISDLNGLRGGVGKRCLIQVQGRALHLVVEGTGADAFSAVDGAVERLGRSVRRAMDRGRTHDLGARRMAPHLAL